MAARNTPWTWLRRLGTRRGPVPSPHITASSTPHPFDTRHHVDTDGLLYPDQLRTGHPHDPFTTAYYGMAPSRFHFMLNMWIADTAHSSTASTTFIDLGCGKGRAVLMASTYPFRQIIGVELHPGLARIAETNLTRWTSNHPAPHAPMRILHQDAAAFIFPPGPCILYLFNPFTEPVTAKLIHQIEHQFAQRPGQLDILYFNPQCSALFEQNPGFRCLWSGPLPLSDEDRDADPIAGPDDLCTLYRWKGRPSPQ